MAERNSDQDFAPPGKAQTVLELIGCGVDRDEAIRAPGRLPLTYEALRDQVATTGKWLASHGVTRSDKVAIVLPNGPEAATAFLSIAARAVAAPLNLGYRKPEFDFYLEDLKARVLLVGNEYDGPAIEAARERDVPILRLCVPPDAPAGNFVIEDAAPSESCESPSSTASDPALVLHTSGTTSRPKIVPLSHLNLAASAGHIVEALSLTADDRCLNVMPLFHIHGLVAALLATMRSGGTIVCTPGFDALQFHRWLHDERPTWYTAVPTMHQAVLARGARQKATEKPPSLRLIRSSSSSLPPTVFQDLESFFGCPVIEAYGMTEAAHQMAANPLPPLPRRSGTVGIASGPRVGIAADDNSLLPVGKTGEIVISGPNVTSGYENNPQANAESFFTDDEGTRWFRTGDQGWLDDDCYLRISGRIKEIINRGGEKIAPREVDEVLLEHEAVDQVVTFALAHPKLGEDIAAAVILSPGVQVEEADLREFARARLADFKVPRTIVFVSEIPKGPTGKLQRIGLARKLDLE